MNDLQPKSVVPNTTEVSDDELDFETTGVVTSVEQVMEEDVNDVEILRGKRSSERRM